MTITIHGMRVSGIASYRQYFDSDEVIRLLSERPQQFRAFLQDCFPENVAVDLFGINNPDGSPRRDSLVSLLNHPEDCTVMKPWMFTEKPGNGAVTVNMENVRSALVRMYGNYLSFVAGMCRSDARWMVFSSYPSVKEMDDAIVHTLSRLSCEFGDRIPPVGAVRLVLYCMLCVQAGLFPDTPEQLETFERFLRKNLPATGTVLSTQREIMLNGDLELPFYSGRQEDPGMLEVVKFHNESDLPQKLSLAGMERTVAPGQVIFAVRKSGKYVGFLPRAAVISDTILKMENGRLCAVYKGDIQYLTGKTEIPSSFAHSNEFGTFMVDELGRLDAEQVWPYEMPQKPVVQVSACAGSYGMLLCDGSVSGWPGLDEVRGVIQVYVGLNSRAVMDSRRHPVLQNGACLSDIQALDVRTANEHYIVQMEGGIIRTDTGLKYGTRVCAVDVSEAGFFVADNETVNLYDFNNRCVKTWNCAANEIAASDTILCCHRSADGLAEIIPIWSGTV